LAKAHPDPDKKQPDPSELKIALDNRAFEIQLFWQRSNYFLVLMTALGIGAFSVKDPMFSPAIALFATACSYFWFRTNLGSKFWQESWEVEVTELSRELGVRSFEKSTAQVREQVRKSLSDGRTSEKRSLLRIWVDRLTIRKYSVTYNMILLSFVSTMVWLFVAIVLIIRAFSAEASVDASKPRSPALQFPPPAAAIGNSPSPSTQGVHEVPPLPPVENAQKANVAPQGPPNNEIRAQSH
jgi:hypothetical protein